MMRIEDIQQLRQSSEENKVLFKERSIGKYDMACELVVWSLQLPRIQVPAINNTIR